MNYKLTAIICISFVLLTLNLGKWGLMETSEARYAEISKEMVENEDYLHPKLLGIYHYHKPPLTYQITTLGYKIFGINEFGARFFLQFSILIQMLLIYQISYLLFVRKEIAFASSLIYFSLPIVLISSRNLTTDAYLNTFILGAICSWLTWQREQNKHIFLYLFFGCLGISFEIKGPVSIIFPIVFILTYKLTFKDRFRITWHHISGTLLFFIVAFAWYLFVVLENEELWNYFFKDQIVNRIASHSYNRAKPIWFYLVIVPLIGFPWIFVVVHYFKSRYKRSINSKSIELVLFLTILVLILIFSLFKTKLILYVLPMFGFLSMLSAKCLFSLTNNHLNFYNRIIIGLTVLFSITLTVISQLNIEYQFDFLTAIFMIFISVLAAVLIYKTSTSKPLKTAYLGFVFGCVILFSGTQFLIKNESSLNSPRKAIQFIDKDLDNINNVLIYNYLLASTEFYSDKNFITLNKGHNTVQRETQFETDLKWRNNLIDIRTDEGKQKVNNIIQNNSALLLRKKDENKKYIKSIEQRFTNKEDYGSWLLYY
ncbi:MAG: glycosyltransferase family 39 protein [Bacteroidia bacterium]|nr:glycosyltransferase family 39 protein [Bacteroidia bacterium]